jgi:hypothetical protein
VKEAVAILEELEDKRPGFYFTAANLGTAYELSGENEKGSGPSRPRRRRAPDLDGLLRPHPKAKTSGRLTTEASSPEGLDGGGEEPEADEE